jgi:hypothetical protein
MLKSPLADLSANPRFGVDRRSFLKSIGGGLAVLLAAMI